MVRHRAGLNSPDPYQHEGFDDSFAHNNDSYHSTLGERDGSSTPGRHDSGHGNKNTVRKITSISMAIEAPFLLDSAGCFCESIWNWPTPGVVRGGCTHCQRLLYTPAVHMHGVRKHFQLDESKASLSSDPSNLLRASETKLAPGSFLYNRLRSVAYDLNTKCSHF